MALLPFQHQYLLLVLLLLLLLIELCTLGITARRSSSSSSTRSGRGHRRGVLILAKYTVKGTKVSHRPRLLSCQLALHVVLPGCS
jgi:hypothetical protein